MAAAPPSGSQVSCEDEEEDDLKPAPFFLTAVAWHDAEANARRRFLATPALANTGALVSLAGIQGWI